MNVRYFAMLLLALAAVQGRAAGQAVEEGRRVLANTITVTGTGEAKAAPDVAHVTVGVVTESAKAKDAAAANAQTATRIMAALKTQGIAEKDIQTSGFDVQPTYENAPRGNPRIVGYRVSNQVRATVRKLNTVGGVLDAALEAGANTIHGVYFALEDKAKAESMALAGAVGEARRKADTMARAAGLRVTSVVQMQEGVVMRPMPVYQESMMTMRAGAGAPTPVSPGEMTVTANVTIVYSTAVGAADSGKRPQVAKQK